MKGYGNTVGNSSHINPEQGVELFKLQFHIVPGITQEILRLSGGNPRLVHAIFMEMGRAISRDPMAHTTVEYIREILTAPGDPCDPND